jgi:purine-binding chemotaxis protein CheW
VISINSDKNANTLQYVTFYINKRLYGIDIKMVQEVSPGTKISSVPLSKKHISGLVNVRGDVILVLDLAVIFNNSISKITDTSHVIILKTEQKLLQLNDMSLNLKSTGFGSKPIGILVDNIGDVVEIDLKDIESPPSNVDKKNAVYYESVAKLKDDLLIILNINEIISIGVEK